MKIFELGSVDGEDELPIDALPVGTPLDIL
jgi:hypothetical protein